MKLSDLQEKAKLKLLKFIHDDTTIHKTFLLEGQGGSGKTTTISNILTELIVNNYFFTEDLMVKKKLIILAPTNAARKVLDKKFWEMMEGETEDLFAMKKMIDIITIHKFLNAKEKFDEEGNGHSVYEFEENLKYLEETEGLVIIDEVSMINCEMFDLIKTILGRYRVKIVYMGDRNQLQHIPAEKYIETKKSSIENLDIMFDLRFPNMSKKKSIPYNLIKEFMFYDKSISPVFFDRNYYHMLKGNERVNNKKVSNLIMKFKNAVVTNKSKHIPRLNKIPKITKSVFMDLIQNNRNYKVLVYTNRRKDELNLTIRNIIYGDRKVLLDKYNFLNNENIIITNTVKVSLGKSYHNGDKVQIVVNKYDSTCDLELFGFTRTFAAQDINIDRYRLSQVTKEDEWKYDKFITDMKKILIMLFKKEKCCKKRSGTSIGSEYFRLKIKPRTKSFFCNFCNSKKSKCIANSICTECFNSLVKNLIRDYGKSYYYRHSSIFTRLKEVKYKHNIPFVYNYAITIHKSQGDTFETVIVDFNDISMTSEVTKTWLRLLYVANSRASDKIYKL